VNLLEITREMEAAFSVPPFRGVPVGPALNALFSTEVHNRHGKWDLANTLKNRLRCYYHYYWPLRGPAADAGLCKGRVLITWLKTNYRIRDMVVPVANCLGQDHSAFLYHQPEIAACLPQGIRGVAVSSALNYDLSAWRRDYRDYWARMQPTVARVLKHFAFPAGFYHRLTDAIAIVTQQIAGFTTFLSRVQPVAVLTEFDRNDIWAPLILTANTLGIPTYTMVHGVMAEHCLGFYPVLADTIFCWGEMDRENLIAEGLEPSRAIIGGCPRLTRELAASPTAARAKVGLAPEKPVVMLGTNPIPDDCCQRLAATFCEALHDQDAVSAVVRLHPVEKLEAYSELISRFPGVKFLGNDAWSLDEALAAAEVVVVHCSGLGSDALVKRRLTAVLDVIDMPLGHGQELIDLAGCPRAGSAGELRDILQELLHDEEQRRRHREAAEQFVGKFCAFFGDDAARRIADHVLQRVPNGAAA
jgi:hypothetical protein